MAQPRDKQYLYFLKYCSGVAKSSSNYMDFKRINATLARLLKRSTFDIYQDVADAKQLDEYMQMLEQDSDFNAYNEKGKKQYSNALNKYRQFLMALKLSKNTADEGNTQSSSPLPAPSLPLQVIYYGAPGTGKSHKIKTQQKGGAKPVRTTFHPDSDYATFVGAYKPTMEKSTLVENGQAVREEKRIAYNFVPQAFIKAYVQAWKHYPEPQYLVIEEINRGNCAQIFGDLFQLLDRSNEGFSEYPIEADSDIAKYLKDTFDKENNFVLSEDQINDINQRFSEYTNIVDEVKAGNLLLLPKNFHILATMNTSDQSLFPIDSAFKRRWEWEYVPIRNADLGWKIEANGKTWDWWAFLTAINAKIGSVTDSEDKKLGYFFVKAHSTTISAETFVSKVVFYLWNDVFKDYGLSDDEFLSPEGSVMTFPMFYDNVGEGQRVNETLVAAFLNNVVPSVEDEDDAKGEAENEAENEGERMADGTDVNE